MKRTISNLIFAAAALLAACGDDWHDASLSPQRRAELLTAQMTLDEKIGQLQSPYGWEMYERRGDSVVLTDRFRQAVEEEHIGMMWGAFRADPWTQKNLETGLTPRLAARLANQMQRYAIEHSRLGIPLFLAEEAPHGHMAIGATVFPTATGQASTWNPALIERMGAAFVRGLGSADLAHPRHALSTLKHFIAYGASEAGQNGGPNLLGERELRETYLPPFRAAIEAGARSVMTAYNSVDGIPCTCNRHTLTDILRGEWGFDGFVISDLVSIEGLWETHGVAKDVADAARQALDAGVDVDLRGAAFSTLKESVEAGLVPEEEIDRAVRRVLALKFEMGLFENPYVDEDAVAEVGSEAHSEAALEVARQSVTLLENRNGTLPLDAAKLRRVAVVGPNADRIYNQLGDYTAQQSAANTVRNGLEQALGRDRVEYVRGCGVRDTDASEIAAAVTAARRADVVVAVVGGSSARDFETEFLATGAAKASNRAVSDMECGEGNDRATLALMGAQQQLLEALKATGRPLVVVYVAGRPLDMRWASEQADALLAAWYPGQRGGDAVADVLLGRVNPAGRLPLSIPREVGQIPIYYNKKRPANHDYTDASARPLYPFGYGLSYSRFEYDSLRVEPTDGGYEVSCRVRNVSQRDGDEVVQLYVSDLVASTVRPVRRLCGFQRVTIPAGRSQTVRFDVNEESLSLIDRFGQRVVEPGEFEFAIGPSSENLKLKQTANY